MSQPKCEVKTTQLSIQPFKNMKKIKSHTDEVFDCCSVLFPSGKTKIITCSQDKTFHIFDLESEKCEKIVKHSTSLCSIHFYEEKQLLMTTDYNGDLCFWNLFSSKIKIIKKIKISYARSQLWKITQINSSNIFFCCVSLGSSSGSLYSIKFENINEIKIKEIDYPITVIRKEPLYCIYELKNEKSTILFAGGSKEDHVIKKFNYETKKHSNFPKGHTGMVYCLVSYINEKNEELILSGSFDNKVLFWTLDGQMLKEIGLNGLVCCFLNDFRRNNMFITSYGFSDCFLYSLNLKSEEIIEHEKLENFHSGFICCIKWINEEKNNNKFRVSSNFEKFISCSTDKTFNIFELEKLENNKNEEEDLKERIRYIRNKEFILNNFSSEHNKKMLFSISIYDRFRIKSIFKVLL